MRPSATRLVKINLLSKSNASPSALRLPQVRQSPDARTAANEPAGVADKLMEAKAASGEEGLGWPGNLRIEKSEKKTLFWKVARPQRTQLKRIMRES